jgi:hypothetical protein
MSAMRILAVAIMAGTVITACGVDPEVGPTTAAVSGPEPTETDEGGFGAPSLNGNELATDGMTYQVTGSVGIGEYGCWYISLNELERLLVFPAAGTSPGQRRRHCRARPAVWLAQETRSWEASVSRSLRRRIAKWVHIGVAADDPNGSLGDAE